MAGDVTPVTLTPPCCPCPCPILDYPLRPLAEPCRSCWNCPKVTPSTTVVVIVPQLPTISRSFSGSSPTSLVSSCPVICILATCHCRGYTSNDRDREPAYVGEELLNQIIEPIEVLFVLSPVDSGTRRVLLHHNLAVRSSSLFVRGSKKTMYSSELKKSLVSITYCSFGFDSNNCLMVV